MVKALELCVYMSDRITDPQIMNKLAETCAQMPSLSELSLFMKEDIEHPTPFPTDLKLPKVHRLSLGQFYFPPGSLRELLESCPALETLYLRLLLFDQMDWHAYETATALKSLVLSGFNVKHNGPLKGIHFMTNPVGSPPYYFEWNRDVGGVETISPRLQQCAKPKEHAFKFYDLAGDCKCV